MGSMKPHHHHLIERMAHRGWPEEELERAYRIFEDHKHDHHFFLNKIDAAIHWLLFILIIVGNIFMAAAVVPLMTIFPNPGIYAVLIALGMSFGFLCEIVVKHIDHLLGIHHHVMLGLLIPILAAVSVFFVLGYADSVLPNVFDVERNPSVFGIIYGLSFVFPYGISKMIDFLHS